MVAASRERRGPAKAPAARNDRPIFVVGCPRSGTTLLQLMLHAHPGIAIPPESRFLVRAYRKRARFGDLGVKRNRRRLARWLVGHKRNRMRALEVDTEALQRQIVAGPPTVGSAVGIAFRAYAARFGKTRWGDKRPGYWRDLDVVLRLFPDAQVVHIVRDARACVASLQRMPWWRGGVVGAVATWNLALRQTRRDTRRLPPGSYIEVHYERLVGDPEPELRRLCDFLGEDYHPAMTEPARVAAYAIPERKTWHVRTAGRVDTSSVDAWRSQLSPEELGLVEFLAGRNLRAHGYTLSGEGRRPRPGALLAYVRDLSRRRISIDKDRVSDWVKRLRESAPVAARLTSGQRAQISR